MSDREAQRQRVIALRTRDVSVSATAAECHVSRSTVTRWWREHRQATDAAVGQCVEEATADFHRRFPGGVIPT